MKIPSPLLTLLIFFIASVPAFARDCGKTPAMAHQMRDGTRLVLMISSEVMRRTPRWTPGDGDPPLSVRDAVSIAQNWARDKYSRFDRADIADIDLFGRSCWAAEGHWFYIVHFTPVINGRPVMDTSYFVAILMDGTVVEAVRGR